MRRERENTILIEVDSDERRAAVLYGKKVYELIIERRNEPSKLGNVYRGAVRAVKKSINAAFVDIGIGRNCFLPLSEYPGEIKEGDVIFVQVSKDEIGSKPARLTGFFSIAGRFIIYMPNSSRGGVSRNISEKNERQRLRGILNFVKEEFGPAWILRTQASGASQKEIVADAKHLSEVWKRVKAAMSNKRDLGLAFVMEEFTEKIIREALNSKTTAIFVEPKDEFIRAKRYIKKIAPERRRILRLSRDGESIFQRFGVEKVIRELTRPDVALPSGGEIVIQSTEALTTIDVNSRRAGKGVSRDKVAFAVNKEAAKEIMRQIRLRNIGGIIVCDLIDMNTPLQKREIFDIMKKEAEFDRAKMEVFPPNKLGLVEITRQRLEDNILEKITSKCSHCEGSGRVLSPLTMMIRIKRYIVRNRKSFVGGILNLFVHPTVAEKFDEETIEELGKITGKKVRIRADFKISQQEFKVE